MNHPCINYTTTYLKLLGVVPRHLVPSTPLKLLLILGLIHMPLKSHTTFIYRSSDCAIIITNKPKVKPTMQIRHTTKHVKV